MGWVWGGGRGNGFPARNIHMYGRAYALQVEKKGLVVKTKE